MAPLNYSSINMTLQQYQYSKKLNPADGQMDSRTSRWPRALGGTREGRAAPGGSSALLVPARPRLPTRFASAAAGAADKTLALHPTPIFVNYATVFEL